MGLAIWRPNAPRGCHRVCARPRARSRRGDGGTRYRLSLSRETREKHRSKGWPPPRRVRRRWVPPYVPPRVFPPRLDASNRHADPIAHRAPAFRSSSPSLAGPGRARAPSARRVGARVRPLLPRGARGVRQRRRPTGPWTSRPCARTICATSSGSRAARWRCTTGARPRRNPRAARPERAPRRSRFSRVFPEAIERLDRRTRRTDRPSFRTTRPRARGRSGSGTSRGTPMDLDASDSEEEEEDVMERPEERAARKIAATRAEDAPFAVTRATDSARTPPPPSFSSRRTPGAATSSQAAGPEDALGETRAAATLPHANPRTRTASALSAAGPRRGRVRRRRRRARETDARRASAAAARAAARASRRRSITPSPRPNRRRRVREVVDLPLLPGHETRAHGRARVPRRVVPAELAARGVLAHAGRTEAKRVFEGPTPPLRKPPSPISRRTRRARARGLRALRAAARRPGDAAARSRAVQVALEMTALRRSRLRGPKRARDKRFGARRRLRAPRAWLPGLCDRYMLAVEARRGDRPGLVTRARAVDPSELARWT